MTNSAEHIFRFLLSLTIRVAAAIIAGIILLSLVFMIPAERMENNMTASAKTLSQEETYEILFPWCASKLDNWTDSIILLHAAYQEEEESLIEQTMSGYWYSTTDSPHESLLNQYVYNTGSIRRISYARYWHGYVLWLKPLLCITSYSYIRLLNGAMQTLVLVVLLGLMVKKGLKAYLLPVLVSVCLLMPVCLAKSLQYSPCYYMMLFGCIAVVAMKDRKEEKIPYVFLWIGICVAFFDFLTYPIVTVGVPAVLCFVISHGPSIRHDISRLFKICFSWCFGYGGMWAGKWIAGNLLTGNDIVMDAVNSVAFRMGITSLDNFTQSENHPIIYTIAKNWNTFWDTPATYLFVAIVLAALAVYLWQVVRNKENLNKLSHIAILALIACMPFVWYGVVCNHSMQHGFFANKSLVVFAFAVLCMCVKLTESSGNSSEKKESV